MLKRSLQNIASFQPLWFREYRGQDLSQETQIIGTCSYSNFTNWPNWRLYTEICQDTHTHTHPHMIFTWLIPIYFLGLDLNNSSSMKWLLIPHVNLGPLWHPVPFLTILIKLWLKSCIFIYYLKTYRREGPLCLLYCYIFIAWSMDALE